MERGSSLRGRDYQEKDTNLGLSGANLWEAGAWGCSYLGGTGERVGNEVRKEKGVMVGGGLSGAAVWNDQN